MSERCGHRSNAGVRCMLVPGCGTRVPRVTWPPLMGCLDQLWPGCGQCSLVVGTRGPCPPGPSTPSRKTPPEATPASELYIHCPSGSTQGP